MKAERERERNVSWWSLRSHLGKGGWFKLGRSEPAASALTGLGLASTRERQAEL